RTNRRELRRSEFLDAFQTPPEGIALRNVFPKMSAVVYRTSTDQWYPERAVSAMGAAEVHAGPTVNVRDKVLLFVTREQEDVPWGAVRQLRNTTWHLYLLHWDERRGLLFINSSNHVGMHEELARAVGGDGVELIRGEAVFRSLHNVNRLVLTNLGLSDIINDRLRFSLHVGSDISNVLPDALRQQKKKSNLFARGYEQGRRVTIGYSQKGRVWSMSTAMDLASWVNWCHAVGAKLKDESISTADVFRNVILPRLVTERPALIPLQIDWPEAFLIRPEDSIEVEIDGESVLFSDAELRIVNYASEGPIRFQVVTPTRLAEYVVRFAGNNVHYDPAGRHPVYIKVGRKRRPLSEWFQEEPPVIRFEDGSQLEHNELFELPRPEARRPYERQRIQTWDWTGVDLSKESQGLEKRADSIQRRVLDRMLQEQLFQVVFDDDDAGEAADVVCLGNSEDRLIVHLYHCKFSSAGRPGARLDDLYAVCGQAQRSAQWRGYIRDLLIHLRNREASRQLRLERAGKPHVSRFERGSLRTLRELDQALSRCALEVRIVIVQPGLSRSAAEIRQLELLAATEVYLLETAGVPLEVIASE
ncbi:hypothetical protein, partial [Myxococcus xanthus]